MGVGPITFTLVEATPYRLIYSVTGGTGPTVLPNAGAATPDLRTDAAAATPGSGRNPILEVVSTPVADQAEARRVLLGENLVAAPPASRILRAHVTFTQFDSNGQTVFANWSVDADEGAAAGSAPSAGFSVLIIDESAGEEAMTGLLDIFVAHTYDR